MTGAILILGGYGNFGQRISIALAKANIPIVIAGRHPQQADELVEKIRRLHPDNQISSAIFDIHEQLAQQLALIQPTVVINTCGPFQTANYMVAETCIAHQVHYLDLADARDFVTGITELDQQAKDNNVLVVSGASTVPGIASAVIEHYKKIFQ